ncbi:hypothetical protein DBV05_g5000 [Lasiodiplodia theobromae]|uniref:Uncharacterized protein n=1 Tax=Lasiodiplodia theobromae TaxID=45133 RepID=A0A5N5DFX5_9PEZI|nr:hypothetical protein DBV05_g5000 [Lasiodiplodia theobromae]
MSNFTSSDPAEYYGIHTGIFSSKIATSTGSQVLISSPSCGHFDELREVNQSLYTSVYAPYRVKKDKDFANYAQNCYTNLSSSQECQKYVQQQLPWSANRNATCPFGGDLCKSQFGNLELDSGFINSNDHLGLNDPPERQFRYRSLLQCAPIKSDGYKKEYTHSFDGQEVKYMRYYYGELRPGYNYTYEYPVGSYEQKRGENGTSANSDYVLGIRQAKYANGAPTWDSVFTPIPELRQVEGDVTLMFLSANYVLFTTETDDLWYSAHRNVDLIGLSTLEGRVRMYFADEAASALACVSQYQLCTSKECTELGTLADTFTRAKSLKKAENFDWFSYALSTSIERIAGGLGNSGLTSRYALWVGLQSPLPSNQWQLEVEHWFTIWLSTLQGSFVVAATGPSDPEVMRWVETPQNDAEKNICRSQKIITTAYTNFNTFGLCLTLVVGAIIIILSYTIEPVARCLQRRRHLDTYSRLEWCANETLQLQRMAHEELGAGTWHDGAEAVPYTDNGQKLATLDITNRDHPTLKALPANFEELLARRNADDQSLPSKEGDEAASDKASSDHTISGKLPHHTCTAVEVSENPQNADESEKHRGNEADESLRVKRRPIDLCNV